MGGRNSTRPFQAHSIFLDPTITVDSNQSFKPKPYEYNGAVFGFYFKSPKVRIMDSSQHTNADYSRLMLDKDSLSSGQNLLV